MIAVLSGTIQASPASPRGEQNGQRRLGTVSGGTESIETENGDALRRPDPLVVFFAGSQWPAEQDVSKGHR